MPQSSIKLQDVKLKGIFSFASCARVLERGADIHFCASWARQQHLVEVRKIAEHEPTLATNDSLGSQRSYKWQQIGTLSIIGTQRSVGG